MQAETLMKTLVLFSSRPITVHIAHNDIAIVKHMEEAVLKFGLGDWLRYKECPNVQIQSNPITDWIP